MGKIIKCWKCGEILARVVGETALYRNLDLYVFHLTMFGDSLRLVCDCGETASINEASITEEELVHS